MAPDAHGFASAFFRNPIKCPRVRKSLRIQQVSDEVTQFLGVENIDEAWGHHRDGALANLLDVISREAAQFLTDEHLDPFVTLSLDDESGDDFTL